ncbi:hypothetical protein ACFY2R_23910 [Micromonospora olivasterospora]|uniref:Uncharacterized protein n=1 Tax=Micromonospora olivasterospora TaxID=1880 RepID=A0A562IJ24_MICOL|nr:hypothetical protein [Micromonospora olivasterospora]TWH70868.1 hypothetical protein JD77_05893 [Micromonospora olivasterospora]
MIDGSQRRRIRRLASLGVGVLLASLLAPTHTAQAQPDPAPAPGKATFSEPAAFDVTAPLRDIASTARRSLASTPWQLPEERGPRLSDRGHTPDQAIQAKKPPRTIGGTTANFEGLSNQDNFNVTGRRVNPPDPVGDVGPNHYVEMVNLVFGVYSKSGQMLLGPLALGDLWAGFAVDECTDDSGDPVVLYDQRADRWILTQFTTRGSNYPNEPANLFYNCVAVSTTGDPTGFYYRYAFSTGYNFPDYPKYGIWGDSYLITTREFGTVDPSVYGIGVYGLERDRMIAGDPNARAVGFLLQEGRVPLNLIGDGLLPADADGPKPPPAGSPAPIVGTQDDGAGYGATFDAVNVWEFNVTWNAAPTASIGLKTQLPTAQFDSVFPCQPTARDCLPQPASPTPTSTSTYSRTGSGPPGGWPTARSTRTSPWSPTSPSRRCPGRPVSVGGSCAATSAANTPSARKAPSLLTLGEGTIVNGTAAQTSLNSRWGDYSSMNVDPVDDCTFWYVNEYYTQAGAAQAPNGNGWQTRIASFRLPHC